MTTIQLYNKHIAGEVSRDKFLYEVRRDPNFKQWITNVTTYDDAVRILKNKGIITEAANRKAKTLNIDQVNPYEYKKGIDYELGLADQPIPAWGVEFTGDSEFARCQKKVLANLSKDPLYYTHHCNGIKPDNETDWTAVKKNKNVAHKSSQMKELSKTKTKANVKTTLGDKEKAKGSPKGVKVMTTTPKKSKGVKVMAIPKSKGKTIREGFSLSKMLEGMEDISDPTTPNNTLPYGKVQIGATAKDLYGDSGKVLALGDYNKLKKYDTSGAMDDYLKSSPNGVDGTELLAIQFPDKTTGVYVYGPQGAFVSNDGLQEDDVYKDDKFDYLTSGEDNYIGDAGFEDLDVVHRDVKYGQANQPERPIGDANSWDSLSYEDRMNVLLSYVKDPDEAESYADMDFNNLPDNIAANIDRETPSPQQETKVNMKSDLIKEIVTKIYREELAKKSSIKEDVATAAKKTKKEREEYLKAKQAEVGEELKTSKMNEVDADLAHKATTKQVPVDKKEKIEAKAAILVTLGEAGLDDKIDLENNLVVKGDNIWLKLNVGSDILTAEVLKALTGDSKFAGVDPISQTEISLIFKR